MPGGTTPVPRAPGGPHAGSPTPNSDAGSHDPHRDLWPRDFGRDGVSGLVNADRAMRARDVSRPLPEDELAAQQVLADLLARVDGRRLGGQRPSSGEPRPGS